MARKLSSDDKLKRDFREIEIKKDAKREKLEKVPAEVLAKALRQMLNKNKEK